MTATDELRKLLDQLGVEWREDAWKPDRITEWDSKYGTVCAATSWETMGNEWLHLCFYSLTPEEVLAATLGIGTCKNKATALRTFWCDNCDCALEDWMDVGGKLVNGLRYCPNCGRKVVEL